jgi:ankyrin repeat protein
MTSLLLSSGADPNLKRAISKGGSTPLQISMIKGYNEVSALLRRYGAVSPIDNKKQGGSGASSLMSFMDELPAEYKQAAENLRNAHERSLSKHHQYDTLSLTKAPVPSVATRSSQEPWKTVRLFLSSTFGMTSEYTCH